MQFASTEARQPGVELRKREARALGIAAGLGEILKAARQRRQHAGEDIGGHIHSGPPGGALDSALLGR